MEQIPEKIYKNETTEEAGDAPVENSENAVGIDPYDIAEPMDVLSKNKQLKTR